ncbi:MAG TPA: LysR family transcriptional regulator [Gallionellaceae bacterium]|nr:LysR family transcriptional regulator [Gallionellaceae bacterium]
MRKSTTLRQLELFEAIARLGSFTRAAEELFLTQPTVSMQIKKLTDTVGMPIFEQVGKKIYLTEIGQALLQCSKGISEHLANFEMIAADMKGLKKGKLRLAVVTTAKYFAPRLLGSFSQRYPGVEVSLIVTNRERLLERAANNLDDLYILGQPPDDANVVAEAFLENYLVVIAPADHPLAKVKNIPPAKLAKEPFLLREEGSGTRIAVERLFEHLGLKINMRMELGSNEAIKQSVIGGLGISVLSRHTLELDLPSKQFVMLDVQGFPIKRYWYFAHPAGKQLSLIAGTFVDHLRQASRTNKQSTETAKSKTVTKKPSAQKRK